MDEVEQICRDGFEMKSSDFGASHLVSTKPRKSRLTEVSRPHRYAKSINTHLPFILCINADFILENYIVAEDNLAVEDIAVDNHPAVAEDSFVDLDSLAAGSYFVADEDSSVVAGNFVVEGLLEVAEDWYPD